MDESRVQFFRTMTGYSKWMPAVAGFVTSCKWTQLSLLFTRGKTFKPTVAELSLKLSRAKVSVIASMSFDEDVDDGTEQLKAIQELRSSKVVVAMALETTYWKIALAAQARGLVSGWAWIGLDTVDGSAEDHAPPDVRAKAELAFHGWIYFEPHVSAGRDFFDRVHNATRVDFPTLFDESVLPTSPYTVAMYDAITLMATAVNQHMWIPDQGGRAFLNQSSENVSFEGATGLVKLDANGYSLLSYHAVNLVLENGALRGAVVGVFGASTQSYSSNGLAIIWPGGQLEVPSDTAEGFNTVWLLVGAGATALVVMIGIVVLVRRKHRQLQAILLMVLTEASQLVFSVCMSIANLATDGIVFRLLLRGDLKVSTEIYMAAFATIMCFGVVATGLSLGYRIRNACLMRAQLQQRATQLGPQGEPLANSDARHQSQQHEWELVQTHRTKVTLSLSLMSAAAQGANLACELALQAAASFACDLAGGGPAVLLQICRCPR